jgi:hypothetical protein
MSNLRMSVSIGAFLIVGLGAVQQAAKPSVVKHDLAGRDNCVMCHTPGAMEQVPDVPASHGDRTSETCMWCHASDAGIQTADPPAISHDLAGRDNCLMCHTAGVMEPVPDVPATHEGRGGEHCRMCHNPAG